MEHHVVEQTTKTIMVHAFIKAYNHMPILGEEITVHYAAPGCNSCTMTVESIHGNEVTLSIPEHTVMILEAHDCI